MENKTIFPCKVVKGIFLCKVGKSLWDYGDNKLVSHGKNGHVEWSAGTMVNEDYLEKANPHIQQKQEKNT